MMLMLVALLLGAGSLTVSFTGNVPSPSPQRKQDKPIWIGSVPKHGVEQMPEGLRILEEQFVKNHSLGSQAANEIHGMLGDPAIREHLTGPGKEQKALWWKISQAFKTAQWNLSLTEVREVKDEIDGILGGWRSPNKLHLDVGVLGFGWRSEYGAHRLDYYDRWDRLVQELWTLSTQGGDNTRVPPLTPKQVKERLVSPALTDARPKCEKARDVAGVLAKCLYWQAAKSHIMDRCGTLSVEDQGRLLGFASEGLYLYGLPSDAARQASLREILIDLHDSPEGMRRTSVEWAAGALSLHLRLLQRLKGTMPTLLSAEAARDHFKKLFATRRVEPIVLPATFGAISEAQLSAILDRTNRRDFLHAFPLIRAAFEAKRQRTPRDALHFLANLRLQYAQKEGDMWQAWRWLTEVRHMITSQTEDNWTHTRDDKLRIDSKQQMRLALQHQEKTIAGEEGEKQELVPWPELEDELERWLRGQAAR